ncbi:pentatricopeptide repeat-containing protein At4g17616-like [Chenopodium quinoa]|uniref:At1g68980-like TPR repeats domain-containing protein n=1 Tax=Chenopodium quinoa TaxID=63459 RepID=A0A803L5P6_CHEQI|nr:pentatricopeptide repeat-containing protein At4g17616-like [Chenopodium quinoa]XP_021768067.1 pentatricopeptide repeat-containing protein At4g17616-like [Chenopodium quinoa]XP_021768068.1 pentatricopeptide repeat-containing protein At4g17616-like [Chenopodium quinoa]
MMKVYHRLILLAASNITKSAAVVHNVHICKSSYRTYWETNVCGRQFNVACLSHFCTRTEQDELCWEGPNHDIMLKRLESALLDCKDYEAWPIFSKFTSLYGFPPPAILSKLISGLSYSSDHSSLPKACNLIFKVAKENSELLEHDSLSRLCLSLVRAQMPVLASKVLRLMVQRNCVPPVDVLCSVFMHMVKTEAGTCLASNILLEICDHFHYLTEKRSECAMSMKPSTTIFNLILEACVRSGSSLKGQQIIEAMARIRAVADVHSVLLFTYTYEMNGLRDELKKLKEYVDQVSLPLARHYVHFYDKLLSLHYDFDDIDAAASLVTDIYLLWGSRPLHPNEELMKPCKVPIGSPYLKEGLKVQVMFELLQKDFVVHVKGQEEYVALKNGKLILTSKGLARLIVKYKRRGRITEFSKLLVAMQKNMGTAQEENLCCDVIHACIDSGCLETAHDILDDMDMANMAVPTSTYMLLLNAYREENMSKEAEALVKQIKRTGLLIDASDEIMVSKCISGVVHGSVVEPNTSRQSELTEFLIVEMKWGYNKAPSKVYELNSSMYFFCKAKMMEDAQTTYRKMQELKIQPTVQTFAHLVQGYLSLEMYREITILWGDIKRFMDHGCSLANRDLYELLLLNFLRGGYFERVMEILHHMKEHSMYADRWMYNQEFIRLHKNLYRKLKAMDVRTEAQRLRLEHVKAFRKWVRNN